MRFHQWRVLRTLVCVCVGLVFSGCGGGGGGGSGGRGSTPLPPVGGDGGLQYTGVTTAATLATSNTTRLAGGLLFELGYAFGERPFRTSAAAATARKPGDAKGAAGRALKAAPLRATAQAATTEACLDGGTVETDDRRNASGLGLIVVRFEACNEFGIITDGTLSGRIDVWDATLQAATDLTYTYEDFSLTTGPYITDLGGTVRYVYGDDSYTTTYNTVTRLRPEGIQHRLVNVVITSTYVSFDGDLASVSGRFYHSTHGYIDITTTRNLFIDVFTGAPGAGRLRLDGAGATVAYVEFDGIDRVALSLDTNGDDIMDAGTLASGTNLLAAQNQAPLAITPSSLTVEQGGSVVLDGAGSLDWEGDSISHSWTLLSGPGTVDNLPFDGVQTTVTLTAAGTYTFALTVSDASGSSTGYLNVDVLPNAPPLAQAGADFSIVTNTPVSIEGSATDAEGDAIQFVWTQYYAPAGSTAPDTITGATLSFTPDVDGLYSYTLRASDQYGYTEDLVEFWASPLLTVDDPGGFYIDATTTQDMLTRSVPIEVNPIYTGAPVPLTSSSDAAWLDIVSAPASTDSIEALVVRVDGAELASMENGTYFANLTIATTAHGVRTLPVTLNVQLPLVTHLVPYVGYTNSASEVTLFGSGLGQSSTRTLTINGTDAGSPVTSVDTSARITLPPLPAGEYTINIDNELGLSRPMGRFVVRDAPLYDDGELDLPGSVSAFEYDAERDAFYVVTTSPNQLQRLQYREGVWQVQPIVVPAPLAVSLDASGERLYVTTSGCGLYVLEADTLTTMDSTGISCAIEYLGFVGGLADGRVLVVDTDQWPTIWTYPGFEYQWSLLPDVYSPGAVLNFRRDRMIWAESPGISPPRTLYLFDVLTNTYEQVTVNDPSTYFLRPLLGISGDGSTFLHRTDVYADGQFVGTLEGITDAYASPAVTMNGDRAVVFDPSTSTLGLFDLTSGPVFPRITDVSVLDEVDLAQAMYMLPTDGAVFVFTMFLDGANSDVYRLHVRNLPN